MSDPGSSPPRPDSIEKPKVLLIKILGVCVPWDFARRTLVTFAQEQCHSYISRNFEEEHVLRLADQLQGQNVRQKASGLGCPQLNDRAQTDPTTFKQQMSAYVSWCLTNGMFKCGTPTSELAGYVWGEGFSSGTIKTELYPEVFDTIKNWKGQNIKVFTFSSGSVEGQRSYFEYSSAGDVSKYFDGHISSSVAMLDKFDTACYAKVSLITGEERNQILMLTNSTAEAKAATIAGIPAVIVERENNTAIVQEEARFFTRITKLTELQFRTFTV